jgi:hypothetical protein
MRVASTLSWIVGARPARTSRWKFGGMSSAKVSSPASMRASISAWPMIGGRLEVGRLEGAGDAIGQGRAVLVDDGDRRVG